MLNTATQCLKGVGGEGKKTRKREGREGGREVRREGGR